MKKRLSAFLLAFMMLLVMCPAAIASTSSNVPAESSASAYDVRIEGVFTRDETVTASYEPIPGADGSQIFDSETIYTWYRWGNMAAGPTTFAIIQSGVGLNTYTLTSTDVSNPLQPWGGKPMLFVSVQTKNENGYGEPVFSGIYGYAQDPVPAAAYPASYIFNAHIIPLNPEGTMEMGDTLAARYSFVTPKGTEGEHTYTWFAKDSIDSTQTIPLTANADNTYTIGEEAYGKYIGCTIMPNNSFFNHPNNTSTTALTHYGNLGYNASVVGTHSPTIYSWEGYPISRLLSDGMSRYTAVMGSILYSSPNSVKTIVLDLGEEKSFDGVFFSVLDLVSTVAQPVTNDLTISYSLTGADGSYTDIVTDLDGVSGENEFKLDTTVRARYLKLSVASGNPTHSIAEFYPFVGTEMPNLTLLDQDGNEAADGSTIELLKGATYTEPGWTVTKKDGTDITDSTDIVVEGSVDTSTNGIYEITYTMALSEKVKIIRTRKVSVQDGVQSKGDLAFHKDVTSSESAATDANLVDGNPNTLWETTTLPAYATIDLGENQLISRLVLSEADDNVSSFDILASEDNENWVKVYEGTVITDGEDIEITPLKARYVKLLLKTSSAVNPKLDTAEIHLDESAKVVYAKEKLTVSGELSSLESDLALPNVGEYDVNISWRCEDEDGNASDVISSEGAIKRGKSNEDVVLIATLSNDAHTEEKEFAVTVKKKESSSSSGGGGSRGTTKKVASIDLNLLPKEPIITPAAPQPEKKFSDVLDEYWAAKFIYGLVKQNIISGRTEESFAPEEKITRAEFIKLIVESLELKAENAKADFADVAEGSWYYDYIAVAKALSVVNGTGEFFLPDELISRQDMAVMVQNALSAAGVELEKTQDVEIKDMESVAEYAKEAVSELSDAGIICGDENGYFMPANQATRAQAAKIIYILKEICEG